MAPTVTVVIPAHRAERTIGATLAGVLWQEPSVHEVVVVDDGSDDRTAAVVAAHPDPRIRLVSRPNRGVAASRNDGIGLATGSHIAFCDADDLWLPGFLAAALALVGPRRIVTANAYWMFPSGITPDQLRHQSAIPDPDHQRRGLLEQNFVSTMSVFPRALVEEIGWFDEGMTHAEDWDFWLRAVFAGYRVAHQARPLALYRWSDASLSADRSAMDAGVRTVLEKAAARDDLTPEEREYLTRRLTSRHDPRELYRRGELAVRNGRYREAADAYAGAAALLPSEARLQRKSALMNAFPRSAGWVLRRRLRRRDAGLGTGFDHVR